MALLAACTTASPVPQASSQASSPASPAPTATSTPPAPAAEPAEHRIGVRAVDGVGEFYDRMTGARFVPRGANLIRLGTYHVTLDPRTYDPAEIDAVLTEMADAGYNVVRVFHDHRAGGLPSADGLSAEYMDNVADLLSRARTHGVYVILTQDWLPDGGRYAFESDPDIDGINALYLSRGGVDANVRFFTDFVQALLDRGAALDALWAYELRNELYFQADAAPFSLRSGSVTTANGSTYDLADPDAHSRMLEENLVYWADTMRDAIRVLDPTALVTAGFFEPYGPNPSRIGDERIIETGAVITDSSLDFIDLHGYPGGSINLAQLAENFKLPAVTEKPVVLGEFGAFRNVYPEPNVAAQALISWQAASCPLGFDGWLFWTWDAGGGGEQWNGTDADGDVAAALAPIGRPDPCSAAGGLPTNLALGAPVSASSAGADFPPEAAVDGNNETWWSAGHGPTAWIEVDLGSPVTVGEVRLSISQYPAGETEHRVYGRAAAGGPLTLLETHRGPTADPGVLDVTPSTPWTQIRFLRIETVASPSDVAWREIEVYAAD
jgi:hypothetical protein